MSSLPRFSPFRGRFNYFTNLTHFDPVAAKGEIEEIEAVTGQRVGSTLEDDGGGVVLILHAAQHRHEVV